MTYPELLQKYILHLKSHTEQDTILISTLIAKLVEFSAARLNEDQNLICRECIANKVSLILSKQRNCETERQGDAPLPRELIVK